MTTDAYKVGDISALFSSGSTTNNNNGLSSSSTFTEQIFGTKAQPVKPQEKLSSNALKQLSSPAPAPATAKKSGAAAQKRKRNNKSDKNTQNKKQKSTEKSAETTSTTAEEANAATTNNNDNSSNENNEQQTEENTNEDNSAEKSQFRETRDLKKQKKKEMDERRYIKKADFSDRTLFVGNFPILDKKVKKAQKQIRNLFEPFGKVETVRVRNIAVRDAKTQNRKIALVSHSSNMKQKPFANAYVVFAVPLLKTNDHPREEEEEKEAPEKVVTEEDAATEKVVVEKTATEAPAAVMMTDEQAVIMRQQMENAVKSLNATVFEGRHLIVDFVTNYDGSFTEHKQLTKRDHGRSVFLGNLPFEIDDEDVWSLFEKRMGLTVDRVRIVRDAETQRSRGFGFVMFRDEDDASLACTKSEHFRLGENMIRITRSNSAAMKVKEAKKKREEAKKERANKQSFRDKNMKKPAAAKAMIEAEASTSANPYAGMRADKKTFLERKDKSKQLKQKITKQNKMKQIKAKKGLLKK